MRWYLLGLLVLGCGSSTETASESPLVAPIEDPVEQPSDPVEESPPADRAPPAEEYFAGVPAYPNARFLCSQHVTGTSGHIQWSGYGTADDLATVRAFYEARFHGPNASSIARFEPGADGFRVSTEGGNVLSAHLASGAHPSCDVAAAESDLTYLVVSTFIQ